MKYCFNRLAKYWQILRINIFETFVFTMPNFDHAKKPMQKEQILKHGYWIRYGG